MAKKRVCSHEKKRLKKENFSFLFLPVRKLFPHNCLHSIKKNLKSVGKHLPSKNPHPPETYQSTCNASQLTGFHKRRALSVRCF